MSQDPIKETSSPSVDRHEALAASMKWLHDRSWTLTVYGLFTALLYMYSYSVHEQIPFNLASASAISVLATLFGLIVFLVVMMTGFLSLPTWFLFSRLLATKLPDSRRLIDRLDAQKNGAATWISKPRSMPILWTVTTVALTTFFYLSLLFWPERWNIALLPIPLLVLGGLLPLVWLVRKLAPNTKPQDISADVYLLAVFGALPQLLVASYLLGFLAHQVTTSSDSRWWHNELAVGLLLAAGTAVLALCQMAGVRLAQELGSSKNAVRTLFYCVLGALPLLAVIPPVGGTIAGVSLAMMTAGGRTCSVMSWKDSVPHGMQAITDSADKSQSIQLRQFFDPGDTYLVRPYSQTDKKTWLVPKTEVAAITPC